MQESMINLQKLRAETPGCMTKIHLNNAGAALMPFIVLDTIKSYLDLEAATGGYEAAELKKHAIRELYSSLGILLHCEEKNIAFTANATDAYARALSAIPFKEGDVILTTHNDYASNQIAFLSLKKRFKVAVIRVPDGKKGGVDVEQMHEFVKNKNPTLVAVTHVPTNSGLIQEVEAIGKICKKYNVLYLVDACQSVGQLNINVQTIGCDFLTATFRKFLRGPRGAGFLYISDKVLEAGLEPLFIDMRGAEWRDRDTYIVQKTAQRFEDWEFSYALVLGSKEAVTYALEVGIPEIEQRTAALAAYLRNQLQELDHVKVLDRGERLCGIVTLSIPGLQPEQVKLALNQKNINISISYRSAALLDFDEKQVTWALRVSPHYYNTHEEIDFFIRSLKELLVS